MILILLILVEEDIFQPELPTIKIEPNVNWVYNIEKNYFDIALGSSFYHLLNSKIGKLELYSLKNRDYSEHYYLQSKLSSISYNLSFEHTIWDNIKMTELEGWKWVYSNSNLIIGLIECIKVEDSLLYGGGIRYYHSFQGLTSGFWINHFNTPDYGLILAYKDYRIEFGKIDKNIGLIEDWGYLKMGKFRDRFPSIFFPLKEPYPRYIPYYGTKINLFNITMTAGKRNYHTYGADTLKWIKGECYFFNLQMEINRFGFSFSYKNNGIVKGYGMVYFKGSVGLLEYEISILGLSGPIDYFTGGFSLNMKNKFSPFITVRNLSYSTTDELLNPVYLIGIHYVN